MVDPKFKNLENISSYDYYTFYLSNSRAISIIWFLLTICFTVVLIATFASPNWIGDTRDSSNKGYFGLYSFCTKNLLGTAYDCSGTWTDFTTLPNSSAVKAACFFVGFSCLISLLSIFVYLFCFLIKYERVFHCCAWTQLFCTILLFTGLTVYPAGWNVDIIRTVCGSEANQFKIGTCALRWPYILACISVFECFFLTILSFLLAARQAGAILKYASSSRA